MLRTLDLTIRKSRIFRIHDATLLMELFDGYSLEHHPLPTLSELVRVFIQVAQGLGSLHAMGYVHCDLKPNNILKNAKGEVKVIDFGQSCKIGTVKPRIQGTPEFIAPEQVHCRPVTIQTDVFNLGATMCQRVTGQHIPTLYTVESNGANSFLLDGCIPSPRQLNPATPPALSNLIMECIATNPHKRPRDMHEVHNRLELVQHVLRPRPMPRSWAAFPAVASVAPAKAAFN